MYSRMMDPLSRDAMAHLDRGFSSRDVGGMLRFCYERGVRADTRAADLARGGAVLDTRPTKATDHGPSGLVASGSRDVV